MIEKSKFWYPILLFVYQQENMFLIIQMNNDFEVCENRCCEHYLSCGEALQFVHL